MLVTLTVPPFMSNVPSDPGSKANPQLKPKTDRPAALNNHQIRIVVADGGPIGGAGRQAAAVGDDERAPGAVVAGDHLTGRSPRCSPRKLALRRH